MAPRAAVAALMLPQPLAGRLRRRFVCYAPRLHFWRVRVWRVAPRPPLGPVMVSPVCLIMAQRHVLLRQRHRALAGMFCSG